MLLLFMSCTHATNSISSCPQPTYQSYNDYLASLQEANLCERTLDYTFPPTALSRGHELAQYGQDTKNVIVLFDTSASTKFGLGRTGSSRWGRRFDQPTAPDVTQADSSAVVESKQEIAQEIKPYTKHISLAEIEGLSRLFYYLSLTGLKEHNLFLLGFSSSVQMPNQIGFPQNMAKASDYEDIAKHLGEIIPYPQFASTNLAPALKAVIDTNQLDNSGDTLLVIITDGRTSDSQQTSNYLENIYKTAVKNHKNLDIFTIGAGGITIGNETDQRDQRPTCIPTLAARGTAFNNSTTCGAECNFTYLTGLVNFATRNGRYAPARTDYSQLNQALEEFFTGECDRTPAIYIQQNDGGNFWQAKPHQYSFILHFISTATEGATEVMYDHAGYEATIKRTSVHTFKVTDKTGTERSYLVAPKHLLTAVPACTQQGDVTFSLTSSNQEIQEHINNIRNNTI